MQNPLQPVTAQWEGGDAQLDTDIKFFFHKNSFLSEQKGSPSLFILQEYVVIFYIIVPNLNLVKSSFPRKNV